MIKTDIMVSIAAGEALLFLEKMHGSVSLVDFEQFLRSTGPNIYLVLGLLISERLITIIQSQSIVIIQQEVAA